MFDTIKALMDGFLGRLRTHGEARKTVWLLLFTFLAGWLATAFAGWISYPSYRSSIAYLPGADLVALFFTGGVACFLYFALAYLSGFFVERWKGIAASARNYSSLGARIFGIAAVLFMTVDLYMNYQGTTHRAKDAAGEVATFTYSTPPARLSDIERDRGTLDQLLGGKLGGYGWRDPKTGIYHLNNSGKKYQRELSGNIRRLQLADSTDRAAQLANVEALNADRAETEALAKDALKNAVYGVYVLVLILCIVQAYIVETIQQATGQSWTASDGMRKTRNPQPAPALRKTSTASVSMDLHPSDGMRKDANQGTCKKCGKEFHVRRKGHKYCSEECRVKAWESRTGKQLKKKRNAN